MNIPLINPITGKTLKEAQDALVDDDNNRFMFRDGAWRFVETEGYSSNFGFQWNKFQQLQIDKYNGTTLSRDRLFTVTGWDKLDIKGENVLEIGCGAGRFTQILLDYTEANVYSVDYSAAVEANFRNNGPNERLKIFQASLYGLPFPKGAFDRVFCFGVLQHTSDVKRSVQCLIDMVRPGGEVIVDFYPIKGLWTKIQAKYILRPIIRGMGNDKLLLLIEKNVDWMIKLSRFFMKIKIDIVVNRFIPICDIKRTLPKHLSESDFREWVILDTFDMFSPQYDQPQKIETVEKWFREMGMTNVFAGFIKYGDGHEVAVVKGNKPKRACAE